MAVDLWVTHSLDKLFPESMKPEGARERIALKAAGNETEDAQVAIRAPAGKEIAAASFSLPDLVGSGGARIGKRHLSAHWVWYIWVQHNPPANRDPATYLRAAPAFFPDAFLEDQTIAILDRWTQPLWVSVAVPEGTPPGEYRGMLGIELRERRGETDRLEVPMSVTVWPFTLPREGHLRHTEWFWPLGVSRWYRLEPWSEAHWGWIEKVAADMARHRQDMILTSLYELVDVIQTRSGEYRYDFSRLDRWIKTFRKHGLTWIEGSHVAGRGGGWESDFVWRRLPVRDGNGKPIDISSAKLSEDQFEPILERFLRAVHAHLKQMGWGERYVQHVADEPLPVNEASWCHRAEKVRQWLAGVPTIDAVMSGGLEGYVDIRVPQIQEIHPGAPRNPGEELWSYVCLAPQGPYPNRFLDYPSLRNRIIFWLSWSLELKGFLHWGYNSWRAWQGVPLDIPINPWTDATAGSIYCADRNPLPAGDPHIVYPGQESICSSIRWEVIRKGFEDFEYLYLLEQAAAEARRGDRAAAAARRLLRRVREEIARSPGNHTRDDTALLAARGEAGELLARLAGER